MTDSQPAIEWKPPSPELEPLRRLRDDPGRIVLLIATALLLAGAFLPWAEGLDALQHPIAYTAQMAFAEGYILLVIALILGVLAGTRTLVESTSRTIQLLPLALVVVAVAMWIGANRQSMLFIEDWTDSGGTGAQTLIPLITALAIVLMVVGTVWLEFTRPADIKAATRGLRAEWRISRVNALEGIVAAILAVVVAVTFGVVTIAAIGPNGAFFAIFSTLIGMAVGISLGVGLVRWIRGGRDEATTTDVAVANRPKVELAKVERKR